MDSPQENGAPAPTEGPVEEIAAEVAVAPAPAPAAVETFLGEEQEVDARSVTVARIAAIPTTIAIAAIPLTGISVGWLLDGIPSRVYLPLLTVGLVALSVALLLGYKWPELRHRHLRYRVDESGVRIRQGVLWRKVISIPTSRVQHTDVSQGPVQRHYEIATLTVYTAGTDGAMIALSGLEHGVARRLRDHLLPDHQNHAA